MDVVVANLLSNLNAIHLHSTTDVSFVSPCLALIYHGMFTCLQSIESMIGIGDIMIESLLVGSLISRHNAFISQRRS
jgi:hypothetical protein